MWSKVATDFNSRSPISRDVKQLCKMWRDMKQKQKANDVNTLHKKEIRRGTNAAPIDPVSKAAISILPSTSFNPLSWINDSDTLLHEEKQNEQSGKT